MIFKSLSRFLPTPPPDSQPSQLSLPPSKAEAQESVEPLTPFKATNKQESGICEVSRLESMEKMPKPKSHMLSLCGEGKLLPGVVTVTYRSLRRCSKDYLNVPPLRLHHIYDVGGQLGNAQYLWCINSKKHLPKAIPRSRPGSRGILTKSYSPCMVEKTEELAGTVPCPKLS